MKDEHGEASLADWKEGKKTIWGDPITKLNYITVADGQHENGKVNGTKRARVN
jgi:hypothetical protein